MYIYINQPAKTTNSGEVTIIVESDSTNINRKIKFEKGSNLYKILEDNFKIVVDDGVLLEIEDVKTDFVNDYLAIYVNDEYAQFGIMKLIPEDGDIIKFVVLDI